jgi:hypothetical protein
VPALPTGLLPANPTARRAYGKMLAHRREGAEHARRDRETQLLSARDTDGEQPPSPGGFGYRDGGDGVYGGRSEAAEAAAAKRVAATQAHIALTSKKIRDAGGAPHMRGVDVDAAVGLSLPFVRLVTWYQ